MAENCMNNWPCPCTIAAPFVTELSYFAKSTNFSFASYNMEVACSVQSKMEVEGR
jgi:hypothetical protein